MSLQRNHYEVLGLPPGASTDQIKKKYRELARKFHPDVVQDKALGQRVFTQINQAYSVLGNPERRAQYNDSLQHGTAHATPDSTSAAAAVSKAAASAPSAATVKPEAAPQTASRAASNPQAFADMLGRAENAIMAGKPVEARAFCVRILEADPRQVRALEILGDALVQMGKPDEAAEQYRKALQVSPSSLIQAKLNRVAPSAPAARPAAPQAPPIRNGNGMPPRNGNGTAPANGSAQKTIPPSPPPEEAEKSGGLLGRLLGRK